MKNIYIVPIAVLLILQANVEASNVAPSVQFDQEITNQQQQEKSQKKLLTPDYKKADVKNNDTSVEFNIPAEEECWIINNITVNSPS
ncbi:hypothetical protein ED28_15510 [[Pantoea] beijingensis]|uniref:Uncharacterized protein n=1 Tax=[Pantoea] beijingensis TaxID=1324864 RepID=A0A443IA45_9GAMM|nr:hypothetical protein [[Pantoea] beijingensis]RWR01091.1 hypothetical protein ED28_15510 [[Pantoea] beijingensis]